jgi:hypothetical protein
MYNVIVLAEQAMTAADAAEVVSLHEGIEDPRHYHVLIPVDNARARVESTLDSLSGSEPVAFPAVTDQAETEQAQEGLDSAGQTAVSTSVDAIAALGHQASGEFSSEDPIESLDAVVAKESADEVIIMTRPHIVQEFFHVDWTSQARRRLGVPVLHLVEHESLDSEAVNGQGITGM